MGMTLGQGVPKTTQLKATSQHTKMLPSAAPCQVGTKHTGITGEEGQPLGLWGRCGLKAALCLLSSLPSLLVP